MRGPIPLETTMPRNVVFVAPDDGWKYLSSGVYTRPLEELDGAIESASFW